MHSLIMLVMLIVCSVVSSYSIPSAFSTYFVTSNFTKRLLRPLAGPQEFHSSVVVDLVLGVLPREEGEAPADRREDEHLDGHAGLALGAAGDAADVSAEAEG
ncbi:hypothetical protein A1Q1_03250 [Trichosporon asahii var. asahii CBS 2479]|uniref:Secreted protein n=1 Tax=Trichosporon asahii var. asahii (strain ATCC 90039 / CBS 2479 / JCM 2466 / KCTC 7840 / NBRC 103889/ NCYC 2677 / UAMH 7654) TaxID=1186058 RepID=J6ET93_TRIAS|nr:hypothetical protein A1Q1_03250 [Trichosporon asahii var. asahii CBS 2479]EJT47789.1 hypothetical protein A1Q1_03250 [Trichosporon asahii var. asahii CBS 2479]